MGRERPSAVAGDDPVNETDPSGDLTLGACVGGNEQFGPFNLSGGLCLTRTIDRSGADDVGLLGTIGVGVGLGTDLSLGVYYELSSATNLQELTGPFFYFVTALDVAGGVNALVFWNSTDSIRGITVGISVGAGAEAAVGVSDTGLVQFTHSWDADPARIGWDIATGDFDQSGIPSLLSLASSLITQHQKQQCSGGSG